MKWIKGLLIVVLLFFSPIAYTSVQAEEEDSEDTEDIINEDDPNVITPSEEELENLNEMEVIENVTDAGAVVDLPEGTRQFLTVLTADGRTYYIIITYDAFGQTVNLLRDLNESDIEEMANAEPSPENMSPDQAEAAMAENANGNLAEEEIPEEEGGVNWVIVGVGAIIIGVIAYFKIVKGKDDNTSY